MRLRYLAQPARLRDGRSAWIREVRADDERAMSRFISNLSPASRYFRFMMGMRELSGDSLWHFTRPLPGQEAVLVATPGTSLSVITGVAQFVVDDGGESCEVALVIDDGWQRQGLGSMLLSELGTFAGRHGIKRMHADVLIDNHAMRRLAERTGWEPRHDPATPFVLRLSRLAPDIKPAANLSPAHSAQAGIAGVVP
ncbi:MAG TPA: GNAT family N-acetyltransferase [Burkholderiales bacterium]